MTATAMSRPPTDPIGAVIALLLVPTAAAFLPKLRLAPRVAVH